MKVYCIDNAQRYKHRVERGDRTIWKRTELFIEYTDSDQVERLDCNQCKHKFRCLMDPHCNRQFESK